jgi:hypothetical protein
MRTATLPVRYEIEKTANGIVARMGFFDNHSDKSVDAGGDGFFYEVSYTTASGAVMQQICCTVQSLGGWNPRGVLLSHPTAAAGKASGAAGAMSPIISIRLGSTYCRAMINPIGIDLANITAGAGLFVRYEARIYPDSTHLTGAAFAAPYAGSPVQSIAEIDTAATAISASTAYFVIGGGTISTSQRDKITEFENTEKVVSNIAGTSRVLTIVATSTAAAQTLLGHLDWQEIV